jgi:hypothetical protein
VYAVFSDENKYGLHGEVKKNSYIKMKRIMRCEYGIHAT